jgi:hypothetical protein
MYDSMTQKFKELSSHASEELLKNCHPEQSEGSAVRRNMPTISLGTESFEGRGFSRAVKRGKNKWRP